MAAIQYARLYPDTTQLQAKNGTNLTAGWVMVFLAGTDDPAITYADFNGTVNPQKIVIDDNGRFCAIVDKAKAYRVEVYDSEGMLQWTTEPVWCTGNAGSGMSVTEVVSTNGSISVDKATVGSVTTYDIGIAPADSDEFLEWIKCSEEDCGADWKPVYQYGTMETEAGQGIKVHGGHLYHFTNTFYVNPDGTGITYSTFQVNMYCNGAIVDNRNFDIDTSVNDTVQCEFSTDVVPEADGYVYFTLVIPSGCEVAAEVQCHRIYSGINAVPDTCATKQWVQNTFDYNMSSKVGYSALEYNQNNEITGISGSAIAGNLNSAQVSAIASSYAESAVSSINSSFSSFSSEVTGDISSLSSTVSGLSADMSAYVPFSGLEGEGGKLTGISGSAFKGHEYTGISPVNVDNTADTISVDHRTLCVDSTMTAYNSGSSAVIGVNVDGLDLSNKMDASASSLFYPTSNPSGYITGVDLTPYQLTADMSAYAHESSLSAKLDASASSEFYPASNPSGFLTAHQSLSGYATEAYVDSSVSSKLDTTAFSTVSGDFLTSHQSLVGYATESYVDSAVSGKLDVTASSQFLTSLPDDLAYTSDVASAVSGKLDASASSSFYPMTGNPSGFLTAHQSLAGYATVEYVDSSVSGKLDSTAYNSAQFYTTANPSGFITGVDLSPYQLTADMSGYYTTANASGFVDSAYVEAQVSGKQDASAMSAYQEVSAMTAYAYDSSLSSKLDASAASGFYTTSNESGFVDSSYVDSAVSGKQDTLTFAYDADSAISSINGSALAGGSGATGATGDYVEKSAVNVTIGDSNSASSTAFAQGWNSYANNDSFAQGSLGYARNQSFAQGGMGNSALGAAFAQGASNSAIQTAFAQGNLNYANSRSFAQGLMNTASGVSFAQGLFNSAINTAVAFGQNNLHGDGDTLTGDSAAFVIGDGDDPENRHDLMLVTKNGEITMYSSTADTAGLGLVSSIRALSASASAYVDSAYVDSKVSSKLDSSASSNFYSTSNPSGFISGVDLTPYQLTADMSAYQLSGNYLSATESSNYYSTSNPSGFITGVDLSDYQKTADMSGFIPTSESSNYQQTGSMSAYQEIANMTAYIPVSALGLVEI